MPGIWTQWAGRRARLGHEDVRELIAQFYVTLEASFARVKDAGPKLSDDAFRRVEQLLDPAQPRNWTNAYAIEQLLIHLLDDDTVITELQIRVREAKAILRTDLAEYYAAEVVKTSLTRGQRRALLGRLVNDLQWRYTVNEVKRQYSKSITLNTGRFFILSLAVFAIAVLLTVPYPELMKSDLRLLVPAVLAGCWGAAFSMLSNLKDRLDASELDDLKVLSALSILGSRLLIGAGAASILYFFFVAGLVTGTAFPDLRPKDQPEEWLAHLALLVVWCFVAGFSERLIPGLIARTEARLDTRTEPERFRTASIDDASPASTPRVAPSPGPPVTPTPGPAAEQKAGSV
jgi:hypothetical protein